MIAARTENSIKIPQKAGIFDLLLSVSGKWILLWILLSRNKKNLFGKTNSENLMMSGMAPVMPPTVKKIFFETIKIIKKGIETSKNILMNSGNVFFQRACLIFSME